MSTILSRSLKWVKALDMDKRQHRAEQNPIVASFRKGDDLKTGRRAEDHLRIYQETILRELHISAVCKETAAALTDFVIEVIQSAEWYQSRYLWAKYKVWSYIALNVALVIGFPIVIMLIARLALRWHVSATASQVTTVLTGIFALQKTLSAWYASQQRFASYFRASNSLKSQYYILVDNPVLQLRPDEAKFVEALKKGTQVARQIINAERLDYYTNLTLPSFDILNMLTSQKTATASLVSSMLPRQSAMPDAISRANKVDDITDGAGAKDTGADVRRAEDSDGTQGVSSSQLASDGKGERDDADDKSPTGNDLTESDFLKVSVKDGTGLALSQEAVDICTSIKVTDCEEIDSHFPGGFIKWYNSNLSGTLPFAKRGPIDSSGIVLSRFKAFWDLIPQIYGQSSITMAQFFALACIAIQENSGNFFANPEKVGHSLAYAFEAIPHVKQSYNTLDGNISAGDLFASDNYVNAHCHLSGFSKVTKPFIDSAWYKEKWPREFDAVEDEAVNGFIMQADFYKLRGRGIIQTTGRDNYRALLAYLFSKSFASDAVLIRKLESFQGAGPRRIPEKSELDATITLSSTQDWEQLFSLTEVLAAGVRSDGLAKQNYFGSLSTKASVVGSLSKVEGSYFYIGSRINGGDYPNVVSRMMIAMTVAFAVIKNPDLGSARQGRTYQA